MNLSAVASASAEYGIVVHAGPSESVRTKDRLGFSYAWVTPEQAIAACESTILRKKAHALVAADAMIEAERTRAEKPRPRVDHCPCRTSGKPKRMLSDEASAVDEAVRMMDEHGKTYSPYPCPSGLGWHVGKPAPRC